MIEGFRREDPPSIPQLAVPVSVPTMCYTAGRISNDEKKRATGDLVLIAFYFLLRVGEYTQPKFVNQNGEKRRSTRTKQFSVGNVGFFKNSKLVPRTSSLAMLLSCDAATLKITNQKNGRMGETIHQEAVQNGCNPVAALAYRVHHILSNGGKSDSLLCEYFVNNECYNITSRAIITSVREAASVLRLQDQAIDPDLVGAHSLRAGGAMALKLHGYDDTTIQKMGRWTSTTFLQYIHTQIGHLSKGISNKMSIPLPFTNIAAIEAS
jgi:hypothetical protein